jgi:YVTN family beta-propeller protein
MKARPLSGVSAGFSSAHFAVPRRDASPGHPVCARLLGVFLAWLAVCPMAASAAAITSFTPTRGEPDTSVRINGSGFSINAEDNAVAFNGVPAEIDSTTATWLTVRVPYEAISGPITVTVGGQTAVSGAVFRVPPEIHAFTPGGRAGDSVTIRGINFGETPAANQVDFNGTPASLVSASATRLVATVPAGATAGPITVSAYGFSKTTQSSFASLVVPGVAGSEILYASSIYSGGVVAIDATTGEPFAALITGRGAGPMIADTAGTRLYVLNTHESTLSIVDTAAHTVLATIATDANPDELAIDASGNRVYAIGSYRVTVIDASTNQVVASIDPGIGLDFGYIVSSGADPIGNTLYVFYSAYRNNKNTIHLARIDMGSGTLVDSRQIPNLSNPYALRADFAGGRLIFVDEGYLYALNLASGVAGGVYQIGGHTSGPQLGATIDPVYALTLDTFFAIDLSTGAEHWTLPTPGYAARLQVGPGESEAYFSASVGNGDALSVVDLHAHALAATLPADVGVVSALRTNTAGDRAHLLGYQGELKTIDTVNRQVLGGSLLGTAGSLLVVNTVTADRLGVVRRQNRPAFDDVYVGVPFEIVVQARHADGPTTVVAATTVNVTLAPGSAGALTGPSSCTIPPGGSYCLVRDLVVDTRQADAALVASAASGGALAAGTSLPFAVVGTVTPTITSVEPGRGPVGATVRILGADLKQDAAIEPEVSFNGVPAVVVSSTDEEIVATVPAGATTGPVSVRVSGQAANSPADFTVLPVPSIVITGVEPIYALATEPYTVTVAVSKPSPADPEPTGSVTVTDTNNQTSCTFVLPQTTCSMTAPMSSPNLVMLRATYSGDDVYGTVNSNLVSHHIVFHIVALEIGHILPETIRAGQSSLVFVKVKPIAPPGPNFYPIGPIRISDGTNWCLFGYLNAPVADGSCEMPATSAGPRTLVAYSRGDSTFAAAQSPPVVQSVSSPGGTAPLPPGTELCGFEPSPEDPPQTGFVPIRQVAGAMASLGIDRSIAALAPPSVAITSPSNAATVHGRAVDVAGTFEGPVNTGITVNGVVAATVGGRFLAVAVPVEAGQNDLQAVATTMTGATATATVSVQVDPAPPPIAFEASDQVGQVGYGPFRAAFRLVLDHLPSGTTPGHLMIDFDGNRFWDYEGPTPDAPSAYLYAHPGLYRAQVKLNGNTFAAERYILVRDRIVQRSMLCDVYGYLRDRLAAQDLTGAGHAFHEDRRAEYLDLLTALGVQMPVFAQRLGTIADGQFSGSMADLLLVRDQPDETRSGYPLRLMQGTDGVWRILEM